MSVPGIVCYVSVPLGLWVACAIAWVVHSPDLTVADVSVMIGGFAFISGPFWFAYVAYLSVMLIPRLDKQVYSSPSYNRQYPDSWLARCISLNSYSANLMHERVRRRDMLPVDMRDQPPAVRLALRVHVLWMVSAGLSLAVSSLLMALYR